MREMVKSGRRILLGVLVSAAVAAALTAVLAALIERGTVGEDWASACVPVFACISAFAGACCVPRGASMAKGALVCAVSFWTLMLALGAAIGGTILPKKALLLAIAVLLGAVCAARLRGGRRGGKRVTKRRPRSRK